MSGRLNFCDWLKLRFPAGCPTSFDVDDLEMAFRAGKTVNATQPQAPQGAVTDAMRLDFLEKNEHSLRPCYNVKRSYRTDGSNGYDERRTFIGWNVFGDGEQDTVREAIDYAINLAAPTETPEVRK